MPDTQDQAIASAICRTVAELPDRNSPEGWPEAMIVTQGELHAIVLEALAAKEAPNQMAIPLKLEDAQSLLAWMNVHCGNEDGTDWHDEDAGAVADALGSAVAGFLASHPSAAKEASPAERPVIEAARNWACEKEPKNSSDAKLLKAVITLDGDWPGCDECDFECGEPCVPATVAEMHRQVDGQIAQLIHIGKIPRSADYVPPEGWTPEEPYRRRNLVAEREYASWFPVPATAQPAEIVAPAGWRLVPEQITEDMHVAAVRTIVRCTGNADFPPRVYRAMLAAAPAAAKMASVSPASIAITALAAIVNQPVIQGRPTAGQDVIYRDPVMAQVGVIRDAIYLTSAGAAPRRPPLTRQQLREAFHRDTGCTLGNDIELAERVCRTAEKAHGITGEGA